MRVPRASKTVQLNNNMKLIFKLKSSSTAHPRRCIIRFSIVVHHFESGWRLLRRSSHVASHLAVSRSTVHKSLAGRCGRSKDGLELCTNHSRTKRSAQQGLASGAVAVWRTTLSHRSWNDEYIRALCKWRWRYESGIFGFLSLPHSSASHSYFVFSFYWRRTRAAHTGFEWTDIARHH